MHFCKTILLAIFVFATISLYSEPIPKKVLDTQGSIVRILNFDTPAAGYGASYSTGTGYIIDADKGYIMTNNHVIDDNFHLLVYFNKWEKPDTLAGYVVYADEDHDLAIITVRESISDRTALKLADTTSLSMGDDVFVFGYPATGLDNFEIKLAKGIIGSHVTDSIIQLSATVNPGNSGGPALNNNGEVIGTIFSKLLYNYENVGNIVSNRHNLWTIDSADKYMTPTFFDDYFKERDSNNVVIGLADTVDIKGYNLMAMAHKFQAASERVDPDTVYRRKLVDMAIAQAELAINEDEDNIFNRFHYVNMLFDAAVLSCEGSTDENEKGEMSYATKLLAELEEIDELIDEQPKKKRYEYRSYFEFINNRFFGIITKKGVDCEYWGSVVERIDDLRSLSRVRRDEFDNYIRYGTRPYILNGTLNGYTMNDPFTDAPRGESKNDNDGLFINAAIGFASLSTPDIEDFGNSFIEDITVDAVSFSLGIDYVILPGFEMSLLLNTYAATSPVEVDGVEIDAERPTELFIGGTYSFFYGYYNLLEKGSVSEETVYGEKVVEVGFSVPKGVTDFYLRAGVSLYNFAYNLRPGSGFGYRYDELEAINYNLFIGYEVYDNQYLTLSYEFGDVVNSSLQAGVSVRLQELLEYLD